jgi:hypothetical protein
MSDPGSVPRYRRPAGPPTSQDVEDELVDRSVTEVQASAQKWRDGLAALVTVLTGGLVLTGPASTQSLPGAWRFAVVAAVGSGVAAACAGLWMALRACAGTPGLMQLRELTAGGASVKSFRVSRAANTAHWLRRARRAVAVALALMLTGILVWWSVPSKDPAPLVRITTGGQPVCGKLSSADHQVLVVKVEGERDPTSVPFTTVQNLRIVTSC